MFYVILLVHFLGVAEYWNLPQNPILYNQGQGYYIIAIYISTMEICHQKISKQCRVKKLYLSKDLCGGLYSRVSHINKTVHRVQRVHRVHTPKKLTIGSWLTDFGALLKVSSKITNFATKNLSRHPHSFILNQLEIAKVQIEQKQA